MVEVKHVFYGILIVFVVLVVIWIKKNWDK